MENYHLGRYFRGVTQVRWSLLVGGIKHCIYLYIHYDLNSRIQDIYFISRVSAQSWIYGTNAEDQNKEDITVFLIYYKESSEIKHGLWYISSLPLWWPNDASRHHMEFTGWCLQASSGSKGLMRGCCLFCGDRVARNSLYNNKTVSFHNT